MSILATLLTPDSGSATVCGFDTSTQPEQVREKISLTGQFAAVDGILTGRENLVLVAKLRAVANPTQVADNLLAQFGMKHHNRTRRLEGIQSSVSGGSTDARPANG